MPKYFDVPTMLGPARGPGWDSIVVCDECGALVVRSEAESKMVKDPPRRPEQAAEKQPDLPASDGRAKHDAWHARESPPT